MMPLFLPEAQPVYNLFLVLCGALGLVSWRNLRVRGCAQAKQKHYRILVVFGASLLVLSTFVFSGGEASVLLAGIPGAIILTKLNLRSVRFCPDCAAVCHVHITLQQVRYCSHCGTQMAQSDPAVLERAGSC